MFIDNVVSPLLHSGFWFQGRLLALDSWTSPQHPAACHGTCSLFLPESYHWLFLGGGPDSAWTLVRPDNINQGREAQQLNANYKNCWNDSSCFTHEPSFYSYFWHKSSTDIVSLPLLVVHSRNNLSKFGLWLEEAQVPLFCVFLNHYTLHFFLLFLVIYCESELIWDYWWYNFYGNCCLFICICRWGGPQNASHAQQSFKQEGWGRLEGCVCITDLSHMLLNWSDQWSCVVRRHRGFLSVLKRTLSHSGLLGSPSTNLMKETLIVMLLRLPNKQWQDSVWKSWAIPISVTCLCRGQILCTYVQYHAGPLGSSYNRLLAALNRASGVLTHLCKLLLN